ncbi:unnamed protein product [Echinostoma caproni]|uniref:Uncharacterized protein n=1 Tax=Echinostoma caproni TaxID=27848 RepID=A0A3P8IBR1_9TREM|nr:unnamed protein product [Echinostoma caproni]
MRNLAIVYQRQGMQPLASLVKHWIHVMTNPQPALSSTTTANTVTGIATNSNSTALPAQSTSSPRSDLIRDMTASFHTSSSPIVFNGCCFPARASRNPLPGYLAIFLFLTNAENHELPSSIRIVICNVHICWTCRTGPHC